MYHRFPVNPFPFSLFYSLPAQFYTKRHHSAFPQPGSDCSDIPSLARKKYPNVQDRRSVRRHQQTRLCSLITRLIRTCSVSSPTCPQTTRALEHEHELTLWCSCFGSINPLEYVILCTCTSSLFMCTIYRRIIRIHPHSL